MPRRLRLPKPRHDLPPVSAALFDYLLYRRFRRARALVAPGGSSWELFVDDGHQTAWLAIADEAIAIWAERFPGSRPCSFWWWSVPELRTVRGHFTCAEGPDRCWPTGLPYVQPVSWSNPPLCESEPAFLERLGLWVSRERARVPGDAFAPQPFSWSLTVAPHGLVDDDEDDDDGVADGE